MFENLREDWHTYRRSLSRPGLWVMAAYRFGRWCLQVRPKWLQSALYSVYKVCYVIVRAASGVDLPRETSIGRRLVIYHGFGIVVSDNASLGDDVKLRPGVIIGVARQGLHGVPKIGDRVDIGAGAKILGRIDIGNDVEIGANAVVLTDVPSGSLAMGNPARIIPRHILQAARAPEAAYRPTAPTEIPLSARSNAVER